MPHHIFGYVNGEKVLSVVYGEIETDKVGVIVDRLDQVLMGLRSPLACACETFFMRLGSTKKAFFYGSCHG